VTLASTREPRSSAYAVFGPIGSGGAGTVHLAQLTGPFGFSRVVALKRLRPAMEHKEELTAALIDEARLAAAIRHPNVVGTLDLLQHDDEVFIVLEYVHGESLSHLMRA
jgi:eukaryotic-like serine/threonine-protein kinase